MHACRSTLEDPTTLLDHAAGLEALGLTLIVNLPPEPAWMNGDRTRLSQVVGNMIHNASKFSDAGGRVTVTVRPSESEGMMDLVVEDTGIGIDAGLLERIFETFTQAHRNLGRSPGGLGLGLALVKGFTELHGGRVLAWSEGPGMGSRFTVSLPVQTGEAEAEPVLAPRARTAGRRVLVIEDNEDAASSLRILLDMAGHEVETAADGESGLGVARWFRPQVILCDIGLPGGMDGYDVAAALKGDPDLRTVELIALTGYGQGGDQKRVRSAGFDRHLVKPVDPGILMEILGAPPR